MSKLSQFQAYRLATGDDPPMPIANPLRDSILLDTKSFSGVALRCSYASGGGAISPGYTIDVWFYDRSRGEYYRDKTQTITATAEGNETHHIITDGQTVLFRVAALAGNQPTLEIQSAWRMDAKV